MKILEGKSIVKVFTREGFLGGELGSVKALKGVDIEISEGEILGIVGESGSGKSTLAKIICGIEKPTSGVIAWAPVLRGGGKRQKISSRPDGVPESLRFSEPETYRFLYA